MLAAQELLRDCECGGITRRRRVWLLGEAAEAALVLPPWQWDQITGTAVITSKQIADVLEPAEAVADRVLKGRLELLPEAVRSADGVVRVGTFHMGGPNTRVEVGAMVRTKQRPRVTLVVWKAEGDTLTLFEDSRAWPR